MFKQFLHIQIRIISEKEEVDQLKETLLGLIETQDKLSVTESVFVDQFEQKKYLLVLELTKQKHIMLFMNGLFERMSSVDRELLLMQIPSRVDEECRFFMRFDKTDFVHNLLALVESGNCLHVTVSVASYPKSKENACEVVENYIKSFNA